jgi:hypothetical protein
MTMAAGLAISAMASTTKVPGAIAITAAPSSTSNHARIAKHGDARTAQDLLVDGDINQVLREALDCTLPFAISLDRVTHG